MRKWKKLVGQFLEKPVFEGSKELVDLGRRDYEVQRNLNESKFVYFENYSSQRSQWCENGP